MHPIPWNTVSRGGMIVALLVLAPTAAAFELPPLSLSGDLGYGFDSNVSNTQSDGEPRDSGFASGGVNAGVQFPLGMNTRLLLRGSTRVEAYEGNSKLDNAKLTGLLRVSHRPGSGFYAPTLSLSASASAWEFRSRIRDSNEYRLGIQLVEPVTTVIDARFGIEAAWRDSDSRVFDLRHQTASLDLDWRVAPRLTVYGGYQFRRGDTVSSSPLPVMKSNHAYQVVRAADVIEPDDAYGGLEAGEFAYRLEADTQVASVGFNQAVSRTWSVDLQVQSIHADAGGGVDYARWLSVASVLGRF